MKPLVTERSATPQERARTAAAHQRADLIWDYAVANLGGLSAEQVIAAMRRIVRRAAGLTAEIAGGARTAGILAGAQTHIEPAWRAEAERAAHAKAEALFAQEVAE